MSGKFWDKAWSLIDGCTPVSAGCDNCWLAAMNKRFGSPWDGAATFREDRLDVPLRARKPTVFAIWSDLYHDEVTGGQIEQALDVMSEAKQHTFLIITKRPERPAGIGTSLLVPDNVYHLVTVENQAIADERIPHALKIPGKVGLIIEPMLGPVDLSSTLYSSHITCVLLGGETGPNARPMHPNWARALRDQCAEADVPFFFKSWGEWGITGKDEVRPDNEDFSRWVCADSTDRRSIGTVFYLASTGERVTSGAREGWKKTHRLQRIGAKKAGRLLDGYEHNELPWSHPSA